VVVPQSPFAPFQKADLLTGDFKIQKHLIGFGIDHLGTGRDHDSQVRPFTAGHILRAAPSAVFRFKLFPSTECRKGIGVVVHDEDDITATAPVAPVRTPFLDKLLTTKRHSTGSAFTADKRQLDAIYKHNDTFLNDTDFGDCRRYAAYKRE